MVRVGLFGTFDGDDAVIATVLRAELARRMPGLELRTYTLGGDPGRAGRGAVSWSDQPLGSFGAVRQEELAATLDAVVIAGPVPLDPGSHAPTRLLVEGLGAFEPEVPVAWFAVTPTGAPSPIGVDPSRGTVSLGASGSGVVGPRCPPEPRRPRRDGRPGGAAPGLGAAQARGGGGHAAGGRAPPRRNPPAAR